MKKTMQDELAVLNKDLKAFFELQKISENTLVDITKRFNGIIEKLDKTSLNISQIDDLFAEYLDITDLYKLLKIAQRYM